MSLVLIALGGAGGAVSRYVVDSWVRARLGPAFPWGTFVVNISGTFLLGLLFALAIERDVLPASIRLPIMVGFVGAYTTFSTLMLETYHMAEGGSIAPALLNIAASLGAGAVALLAGLALGRALS